MYAKYTYLTDANNANVFNDVKAILTGTTDKTTLSSACDKTNTTIVNTAPAGWVTESSSGLGITSRSPTGIATTTMAANATWIASLELWVKIDNVAGTIYVATSPTGVTWTTRLTYTATVAPLIAFNGSIIVLINTSSTTSYSSTDGITWTARTQVNAPWEAVAVSSSGMFVVVASSGAIAMTSTDGIVWISRTNPTGAYNDIVWNGTIFCAIGASICATSPDGITWTARTVPAMAFSSIVWNETIFCAVGSVGSGAACATSPDGITWTARTIPTTTTNPYQVAWNGSIFCVVGDTVLTSPDGITWTARSTPIATNAASLYAGGLVAKNFFWDGTCFRLLPSQAAATSCYVLNSFDGINWWSELLTAQVANTATVMAWSGSSSVGFLFLTTNAATNYVYVAKQDALTVTLKALNLDRTSYKYAVMSLSNAQTNLFIKPCEAQRLNQAFNSDSASYAPQVNTATGGTLYIFATAQYCAILSYLPVGAVWGSGGNGMTGCFEYTRDDDWSSSSYPTHVFANASLIAPTGAFSPRVKGSLTSDVTGASAVLTQAADYNMAKQPISAAGAVTYSLRDIRVKQDSGTYLLLGGQLQGLKEMTQAVGSNIDQITANSITYSVMAFGTTYRYALPMV